MVERRRIAGEIAHKARFGIAVREHQIVDDLDAGFDRQPRKTGVRAIAARIAVDGAVLDRTRGGVNTDGGGELHVVEVNLVAVVEGDYAVAQRTRLQIRAGAATLPVAVCPAAAVIVGDDRALDEALLVQIHAAAAVLVSDAVVVDDTIANRAVSHIDAADPLSNASGDPAIAHLTANEHHAAGIAATVITVGDSKIRKHRVRVLKPEKDSTCRRQKLSHP